MQVAKKLGNGFGWGMLLFVSAPPSCLDTLTFDSHGLVAATTSLDRSVDGWRLAVRHRYKDLALDIARPLLGDTHFGSLIRVVGERWLWLATNFAVVLSVGEPRWRGRGIRGADPVAIAEMLSAHHRISGTGTLDWRHHRERRDRYDGSRDRGVEGEDAGDDATFSLLLPGPKRSLPLRCSSSELQSRWLPQPSVSAPHGLLATTRTAPQQAQLGLAAIAHVAAASIAALFVLRSSILGVGPRRRRHQHAK